MTDIILIATVVFGIFATVLSASLFAYFARSRHRVGKAVAYMLLGETSANIVVTFFASLEWFGLLPHFPVLGQTAMRWFALIVVVASSVHLARTMQRVHG